MNLPKQNYDIIIVGGGFVGASLACALQTTALKVAVIEATSWSIDQEKKNSSHSDERAFALNIGTQRIFQGLGIWEKIAKAATPIKHIHVSDQGHFGHTRLEAESFGLPALGYVVGAHYLGQILRHALSPTVIDIFAPAQVQQIHCQDTHVKVQLCSNDEIFVLQTRLLVAADGIQSKVCQQVGITVYERRYEQTAVAATVTTEQAHHNRAYERFTASGPLALLPLREYDYSLVWTCSPTASDYIKLDKQHFLTALQQAFGWRAGHFHHVGIRQAYPLCLKYVQQFHRARVVLIGNAAHTLHPVAGQGLNLGLRDVASLVDVIIRNQLTGDVGHQAGMQQYEKWQQADLKRLTILTDGLVRLFSTRFWPFTWGRNLGLCLFDGLPPLKRQLALQMTGLKGHPSRLLRGLSTAINSSD